MRFGAFVGLLMIMEAAFLFISFFTIIAFVRIFFFMDLLMHVSLAGVVECFSTKPTGKRFDTRMSSLMLCPVTVVLEKLSTVFAFHSFLNTSLNCDLLAPHQNNLYWFYKFMFHFCDLVESRKQDEKLF